MFLLALILGCCAFSSKMKFKIGAVNCDESNHIDNETGISIIEMDIIGMVAIDKISFNRN